MSILEASAETTGVYLQFFVLCMLDNLDVLSVAQQEIDTIIGDNRTPEIEDLDKLPYLQAVIKEVRMLTKNDVTVFTDHIYKFRSIGIDLWPRHLYHMQQLLTRW